MGLRGDERYVTINAIMERRTAAGVLLKDVVSQEGGWVARQCLAHVSDKLVDDLDPGDVAEFRVMEWAAEKVGLV